MPTYQNRTPELSVYLFKTIDRANTGGAQAVSERYAGKDPYIDLTAFLTEGSSVRTTKSVRDPAGGFSVTFSDKAHGDSLTGELESAYGLIEPMDGLEIRMWGGIGPCPEQYPIIMRGFVTNISRSQTMGDNGKPLRQITVSGQDYGKIWQMYQVIYLKAYAEGKALLSTYALWELFGLKAKNAMPAAEFVKAAIEKIINPFLEKMLPSNWAMPNKILTDDITVTHGVINNSYQNTQGSIYEIIRANSDVPVWNELYLEDREDGVHCVYRPIPALTLEGKKIQADAPDPIYVTVLDDDIQSVTVERTDANVANFYWVNNTRYDLIDDIQRKQAAVQEKDKRVSQDDHPNSAVKYYGTRPMYAETQQSDDSIENTGSGQSKEDIEKNSKKMESWIEKRGRELMEMNKDNVVLERGTMRVRGGQMRDLDGEAIKAGDYITVLAGNLSWDAYCVQVDHEFSPFSSYMCTITFERGVGFVDRITMEQGAWLVESATRSFGGF